MWIMKHLFRIQKQMYNSSMSVSTFSSIYCLRNSHPIETAPSSHPSSFEHKEGIDRIRDCNVDDKRLSTPVSTCISATEFRIRQLLLLKCLTQLGGFPFQRWCLKSSLLFIPFWCRDSLIELSEGPPKLSELLCAGRKSRKYISISSGNWRNIDSSTWLKDEGIKSVLSIPTEETVLRTEHPVSCLGCW